MRERHYQVVREESLVGAQFEISRLEQAIGAALSACRVGEEVAPLAPTDPDERDSGIRTLAPEIRSIRCGGE
jgi:hypothetical protein